MINKRSIHRHLFLHLAWHHSALSNPQQCHGNPSCRLWAPITPTERPDTEVWKQCSETVPWLINWLRVWAQGTAVCHLLIRNHSNYLSGPETWEVLFKITESIYNKTGYCVDWSKSHVKLKSFKKREKELASWGVRLSKCFSDRLSSFQSSDDGTQSSGRRLAVVLDRVMTATAWWAADILCSYTQPICLILTVKAERSVVAFLLSSFQLCLAGSLLLCCLPFILIVVTWWGIIYAHSRPMWNFEVGAATFVEAK